MTDYAPLHKKRFEQLCRIIAQIEKPPFLPMGAGACTICETCTWPERPCHFPDKMVSSMEAYGLVVSDVCKPAGIPYYYGPLTLTYSSCVLFR